MVDNMIKHCWECFNPESFGWWIHIKFVRVTQLYIVGIEPNYQWADPLFIYEIKKKGMRVQQSCPGAGAMPSLLNLWFQRLGKIAPLAFLKWFHPNWANIFFTRKTRKGTLFTLNSSLPLLLLVDSCRNNFGKCCRVRDFGRCVVTHMGLFCI